jgi:3-mercaptopyruvate sulfurtransferase SseA
MNPRFGTPYSLTTMSPNAAAVLAFLLLATIAPQAGLQDDASSSKLRIEWAEFKKLHDAGSVVIVDVRGAESFEAGHIPGARSVPLDEVEKRADELKKLKKLIVTYCA